MPLIDNINGVTRQVFLHSDTQNTEIKPIDIYKEMRTLRRTDETLRQYELFMEASGNEPKSTGKFTERIVKLLQGTVIVPYDSTHTLTFTGTMINDAGQEGLDLIDKSPLSSGSNVDVNYFPPQVEVIEVQTGGSSGSGSDMYYKVGSVLIAI